MEKASTSRPAREAPARTSASRRAAQGSRRPSTRARIGAEYAPARIPASPRCPAKGTCTPASVPPPSHGRPDRVVRTRSRRLAGLPRGFFVNAIGGRAPADPRLENLPRRSSSRRRGVPAVLPSSPAPPPRASRALDGVAEDVKCVAADADETSDRILHRASSYHRAPRIRPRRERAARCLLPARVRKTKHPTGGTSTANATSAVGSSPPRAPRCADGAQRTSTEVPAPAPGGGFRARSRRRRKPEFEALRAPLHDAAGHRARHRLDVARVAEQRRPRAFAGDDVGGAAAVEVDARQARRLPRCSRMWEGIVRRGFGVGALSRAPRRCVGAGVQVADELADVVAPRAPPRSRRSGLAPLPAQDAA